MPGSLERLRALAGLALLISGVAFAAAPLDTAVETHVETQQQGARSQVQVEQLDDGTQALVNEYRNGLRELEALKTYHQQLAREVKSQEAERVVVDKQLADIEVTQRSILPLMLRMHDVLVQYVTLDTPFLEQERSKRLEDLKTIRVSHRHRAGLAYRPQAGRPGSAQATRAWAGGNLMRSLCIFVLATCAFKALAEDEAPVSLRELVKQAQKERLLENRALEEREREFREARAEQQGAHREAARGACAGARAG